MEDHTTKETLAFEILGHACLLVQTPTASVVFDPWLIGSCYWRSWWNFPKVEVSQASLENVDAVVISHVHWDHWHGPTLKKFFRDKPIYISKDPSRRSMNDFKKMGFDSVSEVPHGRSISVGDISIYFYNFGLFLNDTALVIEAAGKTLLNANDAKIAGAPLTHMLSKHGPVDFAFRSHSSANARVCFDVNGDSIGQDDPVHYFRSFALFMDAVSPTFAVPFASNHCHLNFDGQHLNKYVTDPCALQRYTDQLEVNWDLKVMLPGSRWSDTNQFDLASTHPFRNKNAYLEEYRESVKDRIDHYRRVENAFKLTSNFTDVFTKFLRTNRVRYSGEGNVLFKVTYPDSEPDFIRVDGYVAELVQGYEGICSDFPVVVSIPNIVLKDAVIKNMFHHATISKRCSFSSSSDEGLAHLKNYIAQLERVELTNGQGYLFYLRLLQAYLLRWRELLVYAQAFVGLRIFKKEVYLIEEDILRRSRPKIESAKATTNHLKA